MKIMYTNLKSKTTDIIEIDNYPKFLYNGELTEVKFCNVKFSDNITDIEYFRNINDRKNNHPFRQITTTSNRIYQNESINRDSDISRCKDLINFICIIEKEFLDDYKSKHPECDIHDELDDIYVYDVMYYENEGIGYSVSIEHGYGFPDTEEIFIRKNDKPHPIVSVFANNNIWIDDDYKVKDNPFNKYK